MFTILNRSIHEKTEALDNFLSIYDAFEEVALNPAQHAHSRLIAGGPSTSNFVQDKVFRHCAIITQLYRIYESFAETILEFWLARLPRYRLFSDLPLSFQTVYRIGIARIIQDSGKYRYRHLALLDVLEKYQLALCGDSTWEFVTDALTAHQRNLRRSEFVNLFHSVGLDGVWSCLENNPSIVALTIQGDPNRSLEKMIQDLVTFRNDAAHGDPDDILGAETLRKWVEFLRAFCLALLDFMMHRIVLEEANHNPDCVLGIVSETFSNNIVVATCSHGSIQVGDQLFFLHETDYKYACINSLQVDGVNHSAVKMDRAGFEVGIRSSVAVPRYSRILKIEDLH